MGLGGEGEGAGGVQLATGLADAVLGLTSQTGDFGQQQSQQQPPQPQPYNEQQQEQEQPGRTAAGALQPGAAAAATARTPLTAQRIPTT